MEILGTSTMIEDDFQYITDPDEYERGMEVYNEKIRQEGRDCAIRECESIIFMLRQKIQRIEQETQKIEQETQKIKQAMQTAEQVPQTAEQMFKKVIRKLLKKGDSVEDIAELLETDMSTITGFLEQIKIEDEAVKS